MVLNDLSVAFITTEVLKHSRKGKPLDIFEYKSYVNINHMQIRNYALCHALGNILPGEISR